MKKIFLCVGLLLAGCSFEDIPAKQKEKVERQGYKVLLAANMYTIAKDSIGKHYIFLHIRTTNIEEAIAIDSYCKEVK